MKYIRRGLWQMMNIMLAQFGIWAALFSATPTYAETADEKYAMDKVREVRDEVFVLSAKKISSQLLLQSKDLKSYSDFLYSAARDMDERGIKGAIFAATTNSQQLKDAAAKLSIASNQTYNYSQGAAIMSEVSADRASSVAKFARTLPYIAATLQTTWDLASLYRDSGEIQRKYPSLPLKATKLEYAETVFDAAVGLVPYVGQIVSAMAANPTVYEEGDLMPKDASRIRAWVAQMESGFVGRDQPMVARWATGASNIPPGLLQYLKACHKINNADLPGLSNLAWVDNWTIDFGAQNTDGSYSSARSIWKGKKTTPTTLNLTGPNQIELGTVSQFSVRIVNANSLGAPALVVKDSGSKEVLVSTFQGKTSSADGDNWSYSGRLQLSVPGRYTALARINGSDNKPVESTSIAFTLAAPKVIPPVINMLSPDLTLNLGGMLTVRVEVANTNGVAPMIYVRDLVGNDVAVASFNTKISASNGVEQWQFQKAITSLNPGEYSLISKVTGHGNKIIESASIRLHVNRTPTPVVPPIPTPVPNVTMFDFMPRELVVDQNVKFLANTSSKSKLVRLVFDQFPGGPAVDMANPSGNGTEWMLERTVTVAGVAANNFQRKVWVVATAPDGQVSPSEGPRLITVKPKNVTPIPVPVPVPKPPAQPIAPPPVVTLFDFTPKDLVAGKSVRFVARTSVKSKAVRLVFEQIQGGPTVEMSNPNGNGIDWELDRLITAPGQVSDNFQRQIWVVATSLDGQTSPPKGPHLIVVKPSTQTPAPTPTPAPQPPVAPPTNPPVTTPQEPVTPGSPQIRNVSPLSAPLGQKTRMIVSGTGLPMTIKLQLFGEQCSGSLKGNFTQREFECTVNNNSSPKQLTVTTVQGAVLAQYSFVVQPSNALPVPTLPAIPEPLKTVMIKGDSIPSGLAWSAKLTTNLPVYSADLVFTSGRRIPFDGGATSWYTDDRNAVFGDAGSFPYSLQIRRQATSALETYPGGVLNVIAPVAPVISPMVTSAASAEQGRAYNLTIKSAATADRVTVKWPDSGSEEELKALDAQRTQWEFRDRLFMQAQQVSFVVKVYKDGFIQPVGQINGTLNVTAPPASMRLLEISKNIVQGDSPLFKVATSLSISRVTVQLGSDPAVSLAGTGGSGTEQNFRGQVLAKVGGQSIPYVITAFNTQGQAATQLNGTIAVSSIGDSLRLPNPIPTSGIAQGDYVNWQFVTNKATDEMWMEFDQPIGRIALNGSFLTRVFNEMPGTYKYQLMRKDQLGHVYPIQGANGVLQIKTRTTAPVAISRAILNGMAIAPRVAVSLKLNGPLNLQTIAQGARGVVMSVNIPALGGPVYFESTSLDGTNWTNKPLPTATLGDYFRGQVKPGNYPARLYLGTGGSNTDVVVGGTIDFTIQIVP